MHSSNWLITNLLLTCFDIFEYDLNTLALLVIVRCLRSLSWSGLSSAYSFFNRGRLSWITAVRIISRESQARTGGPIYPLTWYWAPYVWTWPGPQQTGKIHQNARHINHEHILQIFWRSNMPCSSALFVWLWLWESSENQQLTLRIYVTHSYRLEIEALFLFNVFFPMYPADGAKLLVQHSNCVWCRRRRCIDACFVGLGHQPHVLLRRDPTEGARWEGQVWKEHAGRTIPCNLFLNIFWSFCSLNF